MVSAPPRLPLHNANCAVDHYHHDDVVEADKDPAF